MEAMGKLLIDSVDVLLQLSPPWPHDVCLGLARLLWRLGQLSVHRQVLLEVRSISFLSHAASTLKQCQGLEVLHCCMMYASCTQDMGSNSELPLKHFMLLGRISCRQSISRGCLVQPLSSAGSNCICQLMPLTTL